MGRDSLHIELLNTPASFEKFATLPFDVYSRREAWWPPDVQNEVELLSGKSPIGSYLEIAPWWARRKDRVVARVTAIVNRRYNDHWGERLGHLIHFEAMPDEQDAVSAMLDRASEWFAERNIHAMRSGFAAFLDYPFAIDNSETLSSFLLRANPAYYHRYFKNAGFETERGLLDYTVPLNAETVQRYPKMISGASVHGAKIQSWQEFGFFAAIDAWTDITNAAFERHWGWHPVRHAEVRPMLAPLADTPVADLSVVASVNGDPVGAVFSVHDMTLTLAQIRPGAQVPAHRGGGTRGALINIGVLKEWRGKGINMAMAAQSYLAMAERKMKFAGYTLVLDDNWPSRGTAERLGGGVTGNFVVYRKNLRS